jgi:glycosyltransferase involved in cell wall biosynthesis
VKRQLYPNWELCVADDASSDGHVRPILERYAAEDDRIKLVFREHHGHNLGRASNSALRFASGEFIAFLDLTTCLPNTRYSGCSTRLCPSTRCPTHLF